MQGSQFGDLTKLTELDLAGTRITDNAMFVLGELRALSILSVSSTRVGDEGLARIEKDQEPSCVMRGQFTDYRWCLTICANFRTWRNWICGKRVSATRGWRTFLGPSSYVGGFLVARALLIMGCGLSSRLRNLEECELPISTITAKGEQWIRQQFPTSKIRLL